MTIYIIEYYVHLVQSQKEGVGVQITIINPKGAILNQNILFANKEIEKNDEGPNLIMKYALYNIHNT